jgi:hypothetical protein
MFGVVFAKRSCTQAMTALSMSNLDEALDAMMEGDFGPLLGGEADAWLNFARERLELGARHLMLRIEWQEPASGDQYFWLVFEAVDDHSINLHPARIFVPDRENMPESAVRIPAGYEHVPCFEYRAPSTVSVL